MPKHGAHLFARNFRGLFHKLLVFDWLLAFATQLSDISWSAGVLKLLHTFPSKHFPLLSFQHSFQVLAARAARGRSFMVLNSCIQDGPKQYKRTSFVRLKELLIVNSWRPRQPSSVNEAGFRNLDCLRGCSYIQTKNPSLWYIYIHIMISYFLLLRHFSSSPFQDQLALGFRMIQNAYNSKVQAPPADSTTTEIPTEKPGFPRWEVFQSRFSTWVSWVSNFWLFHKQSVIPSRVAFLQFF